MATTTPTPRLIFGREPAAITAAVMAAVALFSGFVLPVSVETTALIQTAVNAVLALVVVVLVRETLLPALVAVIQAGLPLAVVAGWDLSAEQQGTILAASSLLLGLVFTRPQVTAKVAPIGV